MQKVKWNNTREAFQEINALFAEFKDIRAINADIELLTIHRTWGDPIEVKKGEWIMFKDWDEFQVCPKEPHLTKGEIISIFEGEDGGRWEGDNAYQGLQILAKYTDNLIAGANHDVIYSEDVDKLIAAGITKEDVKELHRLNWMVEDEDYLACFV